MRAACWIALVGLGCGRVVVAAGGAEGDATSGSEVTTGGATSTSEGEGSTTSEVTSSWETTGSAGGSSSPEVGTSTDGSSTSSTNDCYVGNVYLGDADDVAELIGVTCVIGSLDISDRVGSLEGLEALELVGGHVMVSEGDPEGTRLLDLVGLDGLKTVTGDFQILLTDLPSLMGVESLTEIGGTLNIEGALELVTLDGLDGLESVGRTLQIGQAGVNGNSVLEDISALSASRSVGAHVFVHDNYMLQSLTGLEGLETAETLSIGINPVLTSLDGLSGFTWVWELEIVGNSQLPTCDAMAFADSITVEYDTHISNNLPDACGG